MSQIDLNAKANKTTSLSEKPKTLSCAVLGLGVGRQHALAIQAHERGHLKYIFDLDKEKLNSIKTELKTEFEQNSETLIIGSFEAILQDSNLDMVCIASFDDAHFNQVMQCLNHGKHVFVEKPLCQTRDELKNIVQCYQQKKLGLCSNLVLRQAPLFLYLNELIQSQALGDIYAFDGDYLYGRLEKITEGWRKNVKDYSVMAGGGVHLIDLMLMLTKSKPNRVQSVSNKIVTRDTEFQYPDFQSSTFYFDSGLIGRITANFGCVHPHQHSVKIFGSKGSFIFDDSGARIHWGRDSNVKVEKLTLAGKPSSKGVLIPEFIDAIIDQTYMSYANREFDLMSAVIAADEALQYSAPIKIEYFTKSNI